MVLLSYGGTVAQYYSFTVAKYYSDTVAREFTMLMVRESSVGVGDGGVGGDGGSVQQHRNN